MKKFVLPSIVLSLPTAIYVVVRFMNIQTFIESPQYSIYLTIAHLLVTLCIMYLFLKNYKKNYSNGIINFGIAFKYAFKITLCWAFIVAIVASSVVHFNQEQVKKTTEMALSVTKEKLIDSNGDIAASEQKRLEQGLKLQQNFFSLFAINILTILIIGTIVSLISAALVKSKTEAI